MMDGIAGFVCIEQKVRSRFGGKRQNSIIEKDIPNRFDFTFRHTNHGSQIIPADPLVLGLPPEAGIQRCHPTCTQIGMNGRDRLLEPLLPM